MKKCFIWGFILSLCVFVSACSRDESSDVASASYSVDDPSLIMQLQELNEALVTQSATRGTPDDNKPQTG